MKLRIKGDSIRIRVTRDELLAFSGRGVVEERVRFAPRRELTYRLARDDAASQLAAHFERETLEVRVPARIAREWCESDLVTLAGTQSTDGIELRIAVEKDFECLTPRTDDEDESNNFPHPGAVSR